MVPHAVQTKRSRVSSAGICQLTGAAHSEQNFMRTTFLKDQCEGLEYKRNNFETDPMHLSKDYLQREEDTQCLQLVVFDLERSLELLWL